MHDKPLIHYGAAVRNLSDYFVHGSPLVFQAPDVFFLLLIKYKDE